MKKNNNKKKIDIEALDDWTLDFFSAQSRSKKTKGGIYAELYRRFRNGHLDGKPDEANVARSEGLVLIEMLNEFSRKLDDRFSYLQSETQKPSTATDPNSITKR